MGRDEVEASSRFSPIKNLVPTRLIPSPSLHIATIPNSEIVKSNGDSLKVCRRHRYPHRRRSC
ncbi:hypothetical protein CCACVL1_23021 [Corchorus capsularis]|uniref:Uncharacterized protein n=1 Tax=Corchorus capsularis TaxID=210143 RepID=A0A1R3GVQ0_COCAP|nr:hypothetical protein CCACVL1_23021 [Corchorus capsularis]